MTDPSRRPPARPRRRRTLPAFAPVPRQRARHDGWTPERQVAFIEALADTGSVKAAAQAVNMAPEGAYQLRRHAEAAGFCRAWEAALALGVQRLEDVAMERALHGVEVPVYSYGKIVGTRRVFNDRLLMFLLRNRATDRFVADSPSARDAARRSGLARLKREWRKEWERETAAEAARAKALAPPAAPDGLERRIASLHTEWVQRMTPETLRYYKAFRLVLAAQQRGISLAEQGTDPLAPDFDPAPTLLALDAGPPTHVREQVQELGADYDTAQSYLAPKVDWRDELPEEEEEEED